MGDYAKSEGRRVTPTSSDNTTCVSRVKRNSRQFTIWYMQTYAPVAPLSRREMFQLLETESMAGRIYYKRLESREA